MRLNSISNSYLRLVYRLIFLLSTEERGLLHAPEASEEQRKVYAEGYSIARLRDRAQRRRHYDHHRDLWHSLQITFRALAQGRAHLRVCRLWADCSAPINARHWTAQP